MKKTILAMGIFLILTSIITVLGQDIYYLAYELPHKWNHEQFSVLDSVNKNIEEKFNNAIPRGSLEMNGEIYFSYSSFYDSPQNKYYYRFENYGESKFCVTSKIFPPLFGYGRIELLPYETKYFVVEGKDRKIPTVESKELISIKNSCSLFNLGAGSTSVELIVPAR